MVIATQADVWRFSAHLAGREHADDITQDTYARAWRARDGFRKDASERAWLLAIARRAAADHIRAATRRRRLISDRSVPETPSADATGLVAIELLLAGLDPDRRIALYLTQVLGLSYAEAAEVCGCPPGTISSRVARAREDLAAQLRAASGE